MAEGCSSIGRALVSKTSGCGFKSLRPCFPTKIQRNKSNPWLADRRRIAANTNPNGLKQEKDGCLETLLARTAPH